MMGQYCGDSIPLSQISSSNEIMVHFETDTNSDGNGFKLMYNPTSKYRINLKSSMVSMLDFKKHFLEPTYIN